MILLPSEVCLHIRGHPPESITGALASHFQIIATDNFTLTPPLSSVDKPLGHFIAPPSDKTRLVCSSPPPQPYQPSCIHVHKCVVGITLPPVCICMVNLHAGGEGPDGGGDRCVSWPHGLLRNFIGGLAPSQWDQP